MSVGGGSCRITQLDEVRVGLRLRDQTDLDLPAFPGAGAATPVSLRGTPRKHQHDEKQSRCYRASRADERTGSHLDSFSRRVPVRAIDSVMDITLRSHKRAGVGINAQGGGGVVEAMTCPPRDGQGADAVAMPNVASAAGTSSSTWSTKTPGVAGRY